MTNPFGVGCLVEFTEYEESYAAKEKVAGPFRVDRVNGETVTISGRNMYSPYIRVSLPAFASRLREVTPRRIADIQVGDIVVFLFEEIHYKNRHLAGTGHYFFVAHRSDEFLTLRAIKNDIYSKQLELDNAHHVVHSNRLEYVKQSFQTVNVTSERVVVEPGIDGAFLRVDKSVTTKRPPTEPKVVGSIKVTKSLFLTSQQICRMLDIPEDSDMSLMQDNRLRLQWDEPEQNIYEDDETVLAPLKKE